MKDDLVTDQFGEGMRMARQRKGRGYTVRKLDELSQQLAEADPQQYERVSKSLWWELETYGEQHLATHTLSPKRLRTIIQLLWKGDYQAFKQETGANLPLFEPEGTGDSENVPVEVPLVLEGEASNTIGSARFARPSIINADFIFEARTDKMRPFLPAGQTALCKETDFTEPGELAVLSLVERGVVVATTLGKQRYRFELTGETFHLKSQDTVIGVVQWLKPTIQL